jgi:tRNA/tmRNA/rRNA uracil-C5-methylase (TrmA/RlmC/RlmD family)
VALRYVAALNRVAPPRASGYRYLELGCGLGRSLTTLAAANPHAEFVGVDFNPEHTAAAERDIAAGSIANARVITSDFGHLPPCGRAPIRPFAGTSTPAGRGQSLMWPIASARPMTSTFGSRVPP